MTEIIKQPDKSNWDSMIAYFNLNIVEADILRTYAKGRVDDPDALAFDELEMLYYQFLDNNPDEKLIEPDDLQGGDG